MAKFDKLTTRIKRLAASILHKDMNDPRISTFVSVLGVKLSKDKRYCTIYISILGEPKEQKKILRALDHAKGYVQRKLGESLSVRYTPVVKFEHDQSIERSVSLSRLIEEAKAEHNDEEENAKA